MTVTYYINVDSRHRDRAIWPLSSLFEVKLNPANNFTGAQIPRSFRNVVSVELINAIIPNTNSVLANGYLMLNIREIEGILDTTTKGQRYFAKIIPDKLLGGFLYTTDGDKDRMPKVYPFRGSRIDKLTLELVDPNGTVFNFGADTGGAPDPTLQTSFTFKIEVEETQRD